MVVAFSDINWGLDVAEGDDNLGTYFVPIGEFDEIMVGTYRYVLGRKGSGKTAILEMIRIKAEEDYSSFANSFSLRDFPLTLLSEFKENRLRERIAFVPIWKFLINIELAKLLLHDNTVLSSEAAKELDDFINENVLNYGSFSDTLTKLQGKNYEVSVSAKFFKANYGREHSQQKHVKVHYNKASEYLENLIRSAPTSSKFFILFDELDEGYKVSNEMLPNLIESLIRAVEELAVSYRKSSFAFIPVLALRTDIFDKLESNDLNKLHDYIVRLRWSKSGKRGYSLRDIVDARIQATITDKGLSTQCNNAELWKLITADEEQDSLWNYIYNRTFNRPRDVVKFLKCCKRIAPFESRLTFETVKNATPAYSEWFYLELRDELQSFLPIWQESIQCIARIGFDTFSHASLCDAFQKNDIITEFLELNHKSPSYICQELYSFSVIGNIREDGVKYFRYSSSVLNIHESRKLLVHPGLVNHLGLRTTKKNPAKRTKINKNSGQMSLFE